MEELILKYVENPFSAETNFNLAKAYEEIHHYAGAE
jgi:hypothetical protein